MKRVVVTMSDDCHKALKQYAAFYGVTMGEILYHNTRVAFHKQWLVCNFVRTLFSQLNIRTDKRQKKPCFGVLCNGCTHKTECKAGVYGGVFNLQERLLPFVRSEGHAAFSEMQESSGQVSQFPSEG